jgi:hypothetical protein
MALFGTFAFLVSLLAKGAIMRIGKTTIQCTLVTVFILTGCGGAQSGQTRVLNGSQLPEDQGWSVSTNAVTQVDVVTNGSTLTLNTIGVLRRIDQLPGKAVVWFYREVPFDFESGFSIEFTLKVHEVEQSHNQYDAGIMFYGSTIDPSGNFAEGPRSQMLFFDEDAIGWGDETGRFEMDTTDTFHTYTLTVDDKGVAKVYVDGKRRLKRKKWVGIPRIGFGDMTNDVGVNGRFSIGDIIVTAHPRTFPSRPAPRHPRIPPSRPAPSG